MGRAFMLMLPALRDDPRITLVATTTPNPNSRAAFTAEFAATSHADFAGLVNDPEVEAIYIATPHQFHPEQAIAAAKAGKHILVDKPIAIDLNDADRMIEAATKAGIHLIVGPAHSFDAPVVLARQIIKSGEFGDLRMIQALNYTDFLYRFRRPEELQTKQGGGVVFSQAIHQIDVVRLLAGGLARDVVAMTGNWDRDRPSEGAYSALLSFENGVFATLTYSGYAHFDSDEWMGNISELGFDKSPDSYGRTRAALAAISPDQDEIRLKSARGYGSSPSPESAPHQEHFGPVIALCDRADLRLTPDGVMIFADGHKEFRPVSPGTIARSEVVDALFNALRHDRPPVQTGAWGLASLEVCHAILTSASKRAIIPLTRQVAALP